MNKTYKSIFLPILVIVAACTQTPVKTDKEKQIVKTEAELKENPLVGKPIMSEADILATGGKFWDYYSRNIELYQDFTALDTAGTVIGKEEFLIKIKSGLYYPLALYGKQNQLLYKLAKIPKTADTFINAYMKQFGGEQLAFYKLQGKPAPAFNFTDVNGRVYTSANTKGKIILFKCWFISCSPCVKEMPALNQIVAQYKDRDDVLFISLAMDQKKELQTFLAKTRFDYATIPNQAKYMQDQLHVTAYPTHFLINKKGEMVRMLPDEFTVAEALMKEIAK